MSDAHRLECIRMCCPFLPTLCCFVVDHGYSGRLRERESPPRGTPGCCCRRRRLLLPDLPAARSEDALGSVTVAALLRGVALALPAGRCGCSDRSTHSGSAIALALLLGASCHSTSWASNWQQFDPDRNAKYSQASGGQQEAQLGDFGRKACCEWRGVWEGWPYEARFSTRLGPLINRSLGRRLRTQKVAPMTVEAQSPAQMATRKATLRMTTSAPCARKSVIYTCVCGVAETFVSCVTRPIWKMAGTGRHKQVDTSSRSTRWLSCLVVLPDGCVLRVYCCDSANACFTKISNTRARAEQHAVSHVTVLVLLTRSCFRQLLHQGVRRGTMRASARELPSLDNNAIGHIFSSPLLRAAFMEYSGELSMDGFRGLFNGKTPSLVQLENGYMRL